MRSQASIRLTRRLVLTTALAALLFVPAVRLVGQVRPSGQAVAAGEADPGVRPFRLIDRDEIRVSRVELQPGAVRSVHAHDDVEYHVWTPVEGSLEITIGNDKPQAAKPGQAFFMKRGTPHGFRNTGTMPAAVFEIFVKKSTTSAANDQVLRDVRAAMAEPGSSSSRNLAD